VSTSSNASFHRLDPLSTRLARLERLTEVLRLTDHLAACELHDAHDKYGSLIIAEYEFANPKAAEAEYAPNVETLAVWLRHTRSLDFVRTSDALARLGVFKDRAVIIDRVLRHKIIDV
jgi:hypothetical protein